MKHHPSLLQQILAGLAVTIVIAATLLGGLILALGDNARAGSGAADQPTSTIFRISTLPPDTQPFSTTTPTGRPVSPTRAPQTTIVVIPSSTPVTATREPAVTSSTTPTQRPAASLVPTSTPCRPPQGWQPYVVQSGETLFEIGLRYGLLVNEIMEANCLESANIGAGDVLRVPPVTPRVTATARVETTPTTAPQLTLTPGPTGTQTTTDGACTNADSVITSPRVGQNLSGVVQFRGTARVPDFAFYKLEIRREGASSAADYVTFMTGLQQASGGVLGEINTAIYADGEYWVRLVVVNSTGNYPERCAMLYPFDN